MAERKIDSIVWHRADEHVDVIYVEGEPDRLMGSEHVVTELARSVGLHIAPGVPPSTVRWVRYPDNGSADASALRRSSEGPVDESELHNKT